MYFVSVCSTYRLSLPCIRLDHDSCKVIKIRLYANDMQRSYAEYGTDTRIEPTEATGIYSLLFIPYVLNMSSKHLALLVIKYD